MLRLTIRNLAASKARFAMTGFAVVLGVGFVVASFVLADGLRSTFGSLSDEITDGTDLQVRPVAEFGDPIPLDDGLIAEINAIDGVQLAVGFVEADENAVQPVKADGSTIDSSGPPQIAFSWIDAPGLSPFEVVDGRAPTDGSEFTIDLDTAADHEFVIGESYDVITPNGTDEFELVGTTRFGENNDTVGAVLMQFPLDTAQTYFGVEGGVDEVDIALTGTADAAAVTAAIDDVLPTTGAEIVDNATLNQEQKAEFNESIDIIGNSLLGFAIVSLFVSIFIIYNTFSIVLGQRVKEMALMRAIGADSRQIRRSVLGEAMLVGVVASAIGLVAGVGIAGGLRGLFSAIGAELPNSGYPLATRTVVLAFALGIGVTLISALAPARSAGSVAPIAALRDGVALGRTDSRLRMIAGTGLSIVGLALGVWGLFFSPASTLGLISVLGLAAAGIFVGVTLVSPVIARPAARALGAPLARSGMSGRLAQENAARNPRRTATTGAALMIGLALVSTVLVVGESVKSRLGDLLETSVQADYLVVPDTEEGGLPTDLALAIEQSNEFGDVTSLRYDEARVDGDVDEIVAADLGAIDGLFNLDVRQGTLASSDSGSVLVHSDTAEELGVSVGDPLTLEFATGSTTTLDVAAIYADDSIFDEMIVDHEVFEAAGLDPVDDWIAATLADGVTAAQVQPVIDLVEAEFPLVSVDSSAEFREALESQIDQGLTIVNAMLALAVIIALIGIGNTLALSVHERTRELGLLRAVGMTRRQLRRMVRLEAAIVAFLGALLGVAVGLVFGWGAVTALPSNFADTVAVPFGRIALLGLAAGLAGVVAALLPARRAGRLDVLDAISHG